MKGPIHAGQDMTGPIHAGQDMTGPISAGQDMTGPISAGQYFIIFYSINMYSCIDDEYVILENCE